MNASRSSDPIVYLAARPPWLSRATAMLIVVLCTGMSYAAVAIDLPDVVMAPFVLRPPSAKAAVLVPAAGVVTAVEVEPGQSIDANAVLYRVSSPGAADATALVLREGGLEAESEALGEKKLRALAVLEAEARALEPEITRHRKGLGLMQRRARMAREHRSRSERLHGAGQLPLVELERDMEAETTARLELHAWESTLASAELEQERLEAQRDLEQTRYEQLERASAHELETLRASLVGQRGTLEATEDGELVVRAPCAGHVADRRVSEPGATVAAGEVVALVDCEGTRLRASIALAQSRFPLVEVGQRVQLMYDALPYERWGARYGTITRVSPLADDEGRFLADVTVDEQIVPTSEGPVPLRAGMAGRARVIVGRRTLLDHALAPLRAIRERSESAPAPPPLADEGRTGSDLQ